MADVALQSRNENRLAGLEEKKGCFVVRSREH
jgi:hypothetical protein